MELVSYATDRNVQELMGTLGSANVLVSRYTNKMSVDDHTSGIDLGRSGGIGRDRWMLELEPHSVGMEVSGDGGEQEELAALTRRCPASRRLLAATDPFLQQQPQVVSFAPGCGASGPKPSRRREEAKALQNLQRRVEACRLTKGLSPVDPAGPSTSTAIPVVTHQLLDNRPQILQKVSSRPRPTYMSSLMASYTAHCRSTYTAQMS